jgi:hypothetical protein
MAGFKAPPVEGRSMLIQHEGMRHAPENESGVVFLFSKVARRLGFVEVDRIQPHFPDCWAYRKDGAAVRRVWVEFEFRSRGFRTHVTQGQLHGIRPRRGIIVCWDHDWPECERYAEVIPLRQELGVGRQVWVQSSLPEWHHAIDWAPKRRKKNWKWSVAASARPGDLVLMYRAGSLTAARKEGVDLDALHAIANVFMVKSAPRRSRKHSWQADVTSVARLDSPLPFSQIRCDRVLRNAPFVRMQMFGRNNATTYWYRIYDLILERNRHLAGILKPFAPETF